MLRPLLFVVCLLAGAGAAGAAQEAERYLVVPFENPGREARIYWLGEASAVLLADDLNAHGRRAYTREERLEAFERLQVPATADLSHATVIRLGQVIGATHVVVGSFRLTGGEITVRAETIRLDTGRMASDVVESGPLEDLFAIFERVSRRVVGADTAAATAAARPGLPVFENYVKGLLATATPTKINYLEAAIKLDPSFDRARLALWSVHHDAGNVQPALVAAAAVPDTSPLYARARFALALTLIQVDRLTDAFATLRTLADRAPSAGVMNNMGVVQMRRADPTDGEPATYYFDQAVKLDRDDPDYYFNLGYAYWTERDAQSAIFWLREAVRRDAADGEAHAVLAAALQDTGATAEASRERELAAQLSSAYAEWRSRPGGAGPIPRGLERLKPSLEVSALRRVDAAIDAAGQREQRELAAFHLDRGRRFVEQGSNIEAIADLRRVLYLSPYESEAHLLLGRIYLRTGQVPAAIDAFKISLWSRETAQGQIALARAYMQTGDKAGARAALERALLLDPAAAEASELLKKLK